MRYEDRARPALIRDLHDGVEASLELNVTHAQGYCSQNPRGYGRRNSTSSKSRHRWSNERREVIVWWFVSGRRAYDIVKYYTAKLARGTRFITFGRWEWEARRNTFKLRLNKPPTSSKSLRRRSRRQTIPNKAKRTARSVARGDSRRTPRARYRKLGEFNSKRVREIVHAVLSLLTTKRSRKHLPPICDTARN
jgi:hypothetical protein